MSQIDYVKIIDIMGRTLRFDKTLSLEGLGTEIMNATVAFKDAEGVEYPSRVAIARYSMEVTLRRAAVDEKTFNKWLSMFEYELEQTFARNVEIDVVEDALDYRLTIRL